MPQIVEKPEYSIESWELMGIYHWLHTQEVRGSSPCAPTITSVFNWLAFSPPEVTCY